MDTFVAQPLSATSNPKDLRGRLAFLLMLDGAMRPSDIARLDVRTLRFLVGEAQMSWAQLQAADIEVALSTDVSAFQFRIFRPKEFHLRPASFSSDWSPLITVMRPRASHVQLSADGALQVDTAVLLDWYLRRLQASAVQTPALSHSLPPEQQEATTMESVGLLVSLRKKQGVYRMLGEERVSNVVQETAWELGNVRIDHYSLLRGRSGSVLDAIGQDATPALERARHSRSTFLRHYRAAVPARQLAAISASPFSLEQLRVEELLRL
ncbi:MAG: hypothetical protein AAF184_24550 [Pseudomonadota bacterium]